MKKFFHRIVSFLHILFTNLDGWIHDNVQPSIQFLQAVKYCVENPLADIVTALIPGQLDDKVKEWIDKNAVRAIKLLQASAYIESQPTLELMLVKLIEYLRRLSPELRKGVYMRLASLMARSSGDTETVKGHSVDLLVQMQYSKLAEGMTHEDLPEDKYCAEHTENETATNDAEVIHSVKEQAHIPLPFVPL